MTTATTTKIRLRFAKRGDLRLVSHHDLMRCLERMLRRADLPMARTGGFTPRPKATFAMAMALGIEGRREVLELELAEPLGPAEVLARLAAVAPPGLEFHEAEIVPIGRPAPVGSARYELEIPPDRREAARAAVAELLALASRPYVRRRPDRPDAAIDLRPFLIAADLGADGALGLHLRVDPGGSARPEEVLEALGLRDLLDAGSILARTDVLLDPAPARGRGPAPGPDGPATAPEPPTAPPPEAAAPDAPERSLA